MMPESQTSMTALMRQLTGLSQSHLTPISESILLNQQVVEPFAALRESALEKGIQLSIASAYRDFSRQLKIWNDKATGKRKLYSQDGSCELDCKNLGAEELMYAILRWSALPGTSRHHWGTDMDVWDTRAVGVDYELQLIPSEYSVGGPFERLNAWLADGRLERHGFFRPYVTETGGVSPEPWHLSYRPVAERYCAEFDVQQLAVLIKNSDIELKDVIIANLDEINCRFILG